MDALALSTGRGGDAPREKTELEEFQQTALLGGPPLAPERGVWKAAFLARVRGDGHFSVIDPWGFHLLGAARSEERTRGACQAPRLRERSGQPPGEGEGGCSALPGAAWPRKGQLGTRFVCWFYGSLAPGRAELGSWSRTSGPAWRGLELRDERGTSEALGRLDTGCQAGANPWLGSLLPLLSTSLCHLHVLHSSPHHLTAPLV